VKCAITTEPPTCSLAKTLDVADELLESQQQWGQSMKLRPLHPLPSVKLVGRVTGDLHADLTAYAVYYREVFGEPIDLWRLVVHMLDTFVDSDRAYQTWRRRHRDGART
jgi:hypothetical protein